MEKHGFDRAESGRVRRSGNRADYFRPHHCPSPAQGSGSETGEMAASRDRSCKTMWTELAAYGADTEEAERVFCDCGGRRVACIESWNAADTAASTGKRSRSASNRFTSIRCGAFENSAR